MNKCSAKGCSLKAVGGVGITTKGVIEKHLCEEHLKKAMTHNHGLEKKSIPSRKA